MSDRWTWEEIFGKDEPRKSQVNCIKRVPSQIVLDMFKRHLDNTCGYTCSQYEDDDYDNYMPILTKDDYLNIWRH